ncbi:hypothetical protein R70211_00167 [Paraburkholderia domus]|uniref:Uncharacterized protein n=1 Tax=Paraburkholderia domus TaxID=2793075 RepID=A0A9N8MJ57_9BURK|nr:hypothetical protein R70211_00167 [Paraburkholderia domus]
MVRQSKTYNPTKWSSRCRSETFPSLPASVMSATAGDAEIGDETRIPWLFDDVHEQQISDHLAIVVGKAEQHAGRVFVFRAARCDASVLA